MVTAFVLGGADCVFSDLNRALDIASPDIVIAVNDVVSYYPGPIDVMVTAHPTYITKKHWLRTRAERGYSPIPRIVSFAPHKDIVTDILPIYWPGASNSGSSGLYAVKVARELLNADRVILCGVPISVKNKHFFHNADWKDALIFQSTWREVSPLFVGSVRSMSGFTRYLLGEPTRDWVNGADN